MIERGFSANNVYALLRAEAHPRGTGDPNNFYGYGSVDALAAVQPTPQVYTFTSTACSNHVIFASDGPCDVQPVVTYGFTPFTYYWHFTYGSSMHADIYDTTSSGSDTFAVPSPGSSSYWINLALTVRDAVSGRTRTSGESDDSWVVCPDTMQFMVRPVGTTGGEARVAAPLGLGSISRILPAAKPTLPLSFQGGPPPPQICP